jgi:cytochrome c oxidase subunit II
MLCMLGALGGCKGELSMMDPQGPAARSIANIGWVMFIGAGLILLLVMTLALIAVLRSPGTPRSSSELLFIVGGGLVFPTVTLSALLAYGVYQMGDLRAPPPEDPVRIEVVGNQWWWEVLYLDADDRVLLSTANEIHIPYGTPVSIFLRTEDVIHSFSVPTLAGKIDLVPGRRNHVRLHADRPGTFRGQCAEFCGAQHARMGFHVVAQSQAEFEAWFSAEKQPASQPQDALALRGHIAFTRHCAECHAVRGLNEAHKRAPDLTHVGRRQFLAAGTMENTPDNLRRWIAHAQAVKPGNGMPDFSHLQEQELEALAAFLEGLR